MSHVLETD